MATKAAGKSGRHAGVRYIVDGQGRKTEVVLPVALFKRLLELAEESEDIRDFDAATNDHDYIPWEEAKEQLGL
jgi:hypothetical protein